MKLFITKFIEEEDGLIDVDLLDKDGDSHGWIGLLKTNTIDVSFCLDEEAEIPQYCQLIKYCNDNDVEYKQSADGLNNVIVIISTIYLQ